MEALANLARKVVFYFILLFLILLPLELICFIYLGLNTGQWASANYFFRHHFAQQQSNGCWWADTITPHPYLSFAYHREKPCSQKGINQVGLKGPELPAVNEPGFYDILVLGGSEAELFAAHGPEAPNFLEKRLNEEFISPNGKPFRVLNAAISAGREPMQLISLILFGNRADAVITLEGYNELGPYRASRPLIEPAQEWKTLMASGWGVDLAQYGPVFMAKFLADFAADNVILSHSYTSFLTTRLLYAAAERGARAQSSTLDSTVPDFPFGWSEKQRREEILRQYKRMLRLQRAMAKDQNMPYFAFIQPAPALYKRLTDQERSVVGDISYGAVYQEFADEILALRKEGFPVASLLKILVSVEKSLYVDNIHFDGDGTFGTGNELMAEAIADTLAKEWNLRRK
jgi:lysophospholipase L1-like esterase